MGCLCHLLGLPLEEYNFVDKEEGHHGDTALEDDGANKGWYIFPLAVFGRKPATFLTD